MLMEHSCVSTMEPAEVMQQAAAILMSHGFVAKPAEAFPLQNQWDSATFVRGKKSAWRVRSIDDLPQKVMIRFDRGRVDIVLEITPNERGSWTTQELKPDSRKLSIHRELLTAIALSLEASLARQEPPATALLPWLQVDGLIAKDARRRRRRHAILLAVVVLLFSLAGFCIAGSIFRWFR